MPGFLHNCCQLEALQAVFGRLLGRALDPGGEIDDWLGWDGWAHHDPDPDRDH